MKYYINILFGILLLSAAMLSCQNTEDTFEEYFSNNQVSEVGAPLAVTSRSGTGRIEFLLAISADPRIKKGIVEWVESGVEKNAEFEVNRDVSGMDTLAISLSNIEEGIKKFTFTLFDTDGRASKQLSESAMIYGSIFEADLIARRVSKMQTFSTSDPQIDSLVIEWAQALPEVLETVFVYTDQNDQEQTVTVEATDERTIIKGYNRSVNYSYKTRYIPEPEALDTYWSVPTTGEIPKIEIVLDKTLWSKVELLNDIPNINHSSGDANAIVNSWGDGNVIVEPGEGYSYRPFHFTIDLGVKTVLTEVIMDTFGPYPAVMFRRYQLWGIDDLSGAETTIDLQDVSALSEEEQQNQQKVEEQRVKNLAAWEEESQEKGWVKVLDDTGASQGGFSKKINVKQEFRYLRMVVVTSFAPHIGATAWGEITLKGEKPD